MKKIFILIFTLASLSSFGQVYQNDGAYGRQYKRVVVDSTLHIPTFCGTPTRLDNVKNKAAIAFDSCNNKLYSYNPKDSSWSAVIGGSGSGITQLGTSPYGLIKVNDSTYRVDTASIATILQTQHRIDSLAAATRSELADTALAVRAAGGGVSQSVISDTLNSYAAYGSLTTDNVIFSTPIALSVANHMMSGAFALKTQSGYTLIGRGSGSGVISALTSIDSNWIPMLHSKSYYDALYLLPSQTGNSGKFLTTDGTSPSWATVVASAAGSNTYVQFNDGGTLGGDSTFTFDKATGILHFTKTGSGNYIEFAANSTGTAPTIKLFYSGGTGKTIGINSLNNLTASGVFASGGNLKATALIVGANPTATTGNVATTTPTTGSIILAPTGGDSYIYYFNSGSFSAAAAGTSSSTGDYIHYRNPTAFGFNGTEVYRIVRSTGDLLKGTSTDVTSSTVTIASTTQGSITAPLMTTTQRNAIASPSDGLQVYDITLHRKCYYDGSASAWQVENIAINGTAAPTSTPTVIGDRFIDTSNKKIYFATGTSSSSDWTITN